jgi:hypothetical protein
VPIDSRVLESIVRAGFQPTGDPARLPGGGNNRLFRVQTAQGTVVVKAYFHHPDDPRDRLGTEFGFSQFAWTHGLHNIPQPLAADAAEHIAVYRFVDGHLPPHAGEPAVAQALAFLAQLNTQRAYADHLPNASEACFSLEEHLDRVDARVARLDGVHDTRARLFVTETVLPAWREVRTHAVAAARRQGAAQADRLARADRCISPSDFGFHNALVDDSGQYWFLDFEYAGWDDPAKLVCDFFCQPACPVPLRYFEAVVARVSNWFHEPPWHAWRIRWLWPVDQLKWACIMLNEFLALASSRRTYAGRDTLQDAGQRLARSNALALRAVEAAHCL